MGWSKFTGKVPDGIHCFVGVEGVNSKHVNGIDVEAWSIWIGRNSHIKEKMRGSGHHDLEAYFLKVHSTSEALFRRVLFVGLRKNQVSYKSSSDWLHNNDVTPNRESFPKTFNKLYEPSLRFETLIELNQNLSKLWDLWLDFSKIIRNHIAHGIRTYSDEWLICGIQIDQSLIIEIAKSLEDALGGAVGGNLRELKPRLPTGKAGIDIAKIWGKKKTSQKPKVSLESTKNSLMILGIRSR